MLKLTACIAFRIGKSNALRIPAISQLHLVSVVHTDILNKQLRLYK